MYLSSSDLLSKDTSSEITQLKNEVKRLNHLNNIYSNLLDICLYINNNLKSQSLFNIFADMFVGIFGAKYVTIYVCDDFGEYHLATPQTTPIDVMRQEKHLLLKHTDAFIVNNTNPLYYTVNPDYIVYSCMGVPIIREGRTVGFILVHHVTTEHFTEEHKAFLSEIMSHVGIALENNLLYSDITEKANKDALTGLYNRRYFFDNVPTDTDVPYAIVMADIDNFKYINDTFGHPYGDVVLQALSKILQSHTNEDDIVARYGGEELIIYLHNVSDKAVLMDKLEMLRTIIAATQITSKGVTQSVTLSFGAFLNLFGFSVGECVSEADKNLYISKATGKNKCTTS